MKRILTLLLTMILVLGAIPVTAFGASAEMTAAADILYELEMFSGTGTDSNGKPIYDLDRAPTRQEAITMLVTLLGKKEEAMAKTWTTPFTDVANWAKPFVGYAYANGLTSGTSKTTFGGKDLITDTQYLTFVLKALGYEVGKDFKWNKAWELSDEIGLTNGEYPTENFLRGDIAKISEKALSTKLKDSNAMLLRKLYNQMAAELWKNTEKSISVASFQLPEAIGKITLTYDQAYALVGKDPAVIQEAVKTVGDVYQYMIAANFGGYSGNAFTPWYDGEDEHWGFDAPGYEQLIHNYGCCCGGCANTALYLLEEDYDEAGIIRWIGGGNHTINYVLKDGKYYVFDLTDYSGYNRYDPAGEVTVLDRLEDYYDLMPTEDYPRDEIAILVAIQDVTVNPPSKFGKDTAELHFPTGYEDKVKVIYPAEDYSLTFGDLTIDIPMWNTEELDIPATNTEYDTYEDMKEQYKKEKFDSTIALISGSFSVKEGSNFRSPVGTANFDVITGASVISDGYTVVSDYTVTSSNPAIFECTKLSNGKLQIKGKQPGKAEIILTYHGRTVTFGLEIFQ